MWRIITARISQSSKKHSGSSAARTEIYQPLPAKCPESWTGIAVALQHASIKNTYESTKGNSMCWKREWLPPKSDHFNYSYIFRRRAGINIAAQPQSLWRNLIASPTLQPAAGPESANSKLFKHHCRCARLVVDVHAACATGGVPTASEYSVIFFSAWDRECAFSHVPPKVVAPFAPAIPLITSCNHMESDDHQRTVWYSWHH